MSAFGKTKHILLMINIVCLALVLGCGRNQGKEGAEDKRIVAKINRYEMTAEDFKSEVGLTLSNKYLPADPDKAKDELLDELIVKKILIQEALKQNFDKDRAFMKEIERYWEQALLKLLIKKKAEEISSKIIVEERDVKKEYERMLKEEGANIGPFGRLEAEIRNDIRRRKIQDSLDKWITDLRKKTNVIVYKENLKRIKLKPY